MHLQIKHIIFLKRWIFSTVLGVLCIFSLKGQSRDVDLAYPYPQLEFTVNPKPSITASVSEVHYYSSTSQVDSITLFFRGYPPFELTFNPNYFNLPYIYESGTPMFGGYPINYEGTDSYCIPMWSATVYPDIVYFHTTFTEYSHDNDTDIEEEIEHDVHLGVETLHEQNCFNYAPHLGLKVVCHFESEPPVSKCIDFSYYVVNKWDNTFVLNRDRIRQNQYDSTTSGHALYGYGSNYLYCSWYENGNLLDTGNFYTAGNLSSQKFNPESNYTFALTYADGHTIYSCDYVFQYETDYNVLLYPNPVKQNSEIVLDLGSVPQSNEKVEVEIYTALGQKILSFNTSSRLNNIRMEVPAAGYVMKIKSSIHGETSKVFVVVR
jgi:hypothetical protein